MTGTTQIGSGLASAQHGRRLLDASAAIRRERNELFEHARLRAITRGSQHADPNDLQTLEDHARAIIRSHNQDPFDATKYAHDRELEDGFEQNKDALARQADAVDLSNVKVREAREKIALLGDPGPKPAPSPLGIVVALLLLTITFAPTLHDAVFFGLSESENWLSSALSGMIFGAFLVWSILLTYTLSGKRTLLGWMGLCGGIVLTLGFLIFRLEVTNSGSSELMAVAFAVIEFGVIISIEWVGSHLRHLHSDWLTHVGDLRQGKGELEAAQTELVRRQERLHVLNGLIEEHIGIVEERWVRHALSAQVEDAAVKASHDGYCAGLAENQNRVKRA